MRNKIFTVDWCSVKKSGADEERSFLVCGKLESGILRTGSPVEIVKPSGESKEFFVTKVTMDGKNEPAEAGDEACLLFEDFADSYDIIGLFRRRKVWRFTVERGDTIYQIHY